MAQLITRSEIAALKGYSLPAVIQWHLRGLIRPVRKVGPTWLYDRAAVEAFIPPGKARASRAAVPA